MTEALQRLETLARIISKQTKENRYVTDEIRNNSTLMVALIKEVRDESASAVSVRGPL